MTVPTLQGLTRDEAAARQIEKSGAQQQQEHRLPQGPEEDLTKTPADPRLKAVGAK